jgi:hypothetical protein
VDIKIGCILIGLAAKEQADLNGKLFPFFLSFTLAIINE